MNTFAILTDSTCDLSKELLEEFGILYVPGFYTGPDHCGHHVILEWTKEERDAFYKALSSNPNGFNSATPSPSEWADKMVSLIKDGYDILVLSLSSALSGTFNSLTSAKEMVVETYKNARIELVDTLRFSGGLTVLALLASKARKEGKTLDETLKIVNDNRNLVHQASWLDDLSFVRAKGRINRFQSFFGSVAHIKPIGDFDWNGLTTVIGKAKGDKKGLEVLIEYMRRTIVNPSEQIIVLSTSFRQKQAFKYKELIEKEFKPKRILMLDVFPFNGVNVGPGLMASYYIGTPITKGLVKEKEIMKSILEVQK